MNIAGISETKWFGQSIYEVERYTILHSGRPVPVGSSLERRAGVGVVLDPVLSTEWREAGEV